MYKRKLKKHGDLLHASHIVLFYHTEIQKQNIQIIFWSHFNHFNHYHNKYEGEILLVNTSVWCISS